MTLTACVVVPARDEEDLVGACLGALAGQRDVASGTWELLLVLDSSTDATMQRIEAATALHPHLPIEIIPGPDRGSGGARACGMDLACERLHAAGTPMGLIASTDADSCVAPDWLARQLELAAAGAVAIGGRIELFPAEAAALPDHVILGHVAQGQDRFRRVRDHVAAHGGRAEHWQFSGASMAVTAETYRRVGGLGDGSHSEDEALERALHAHGVPIERDLSVRVETSARTAGRSGAGLAHVLARLSATA